MITLTKTNYCGKTTETTFDIIEVLSVADVVKSNGVIGQYIAKAGRAQEVLLQVYANGAARTIRPGYTKTYAVKKS